MLIVSQTLFNSPGKIIWVTLEALCHVPHTRVWSFHKLSCIVGKLQSFFWWHRTDQCLEKKIITSIMLKQRYGLYGTCMYIYIYIFISLWKPMRLVFYKIHLSSCFGFVCFGYKRRQLCMNKNPFLSQFYQVSSASLYDTSWITGGKIVPQQLWHAVMNFLCRTGWSAYKWLRGITQQQNRPV